MASSKYDSLPDDTDGVSSNAIDDGDGDGDGGGGVGGNGAPTSEYNTATWFSCFINLCSTIVGAGILGVPYAFSKAGWIPGIVLLFICATFSLLALHFLSTCARRVGIPSSFYRVASATVPKFTIFIDIAVAIKCFGIATSYLMVVGDSLPLAFQQFGLPPWACGRRVCICFGFLLGGALAFSPNLDHLQATSLISGVMILLLVLLVILYSDDVIVPCAHPDKHCDGSTKLFDFSIETVRTFPIFLFSFSCQQNTFAVVNELQNPTQERIDKVAIASIGTALSLFAIVCCAGYWTFGNALESDILKMYPQNTETSMCRLMVAFIVICHYPLQIHPCRRSVNSLWTSFSRSPSPALNAGTSSQQRHHTSGSGSGSGSRSGFQPLRTGTPGKLEDGRAEVDSAGISPVRGSGPTSTPTPNSTSTSTSTPQSSAIPHRVHSSEEHRTRTRTLDHFSNQYYYPSSFFLPILNWWSQSQNVSHVVLTSTIVLASLVIALTFSDLGVALSLIGATGSNLVILILPGAFYFYLDLKDQEVRHGNAAANDSDVVEVVLSPFQKEEDQDNLPSEFSASRSFSHPHQQQSSVFRILAEEDSWWKKPVAAFMMCLGFVLMPICLYFIFDSL